MDCVSKAIFVETTWSQPPIANRRLTVVSASTLMDDPERFFPRQAIAAGGDEREGSQEFQTVGTVPPSIVYSAPVIVAARSEARKAIRLATSSGLVGRPMGIPPSDCMMICFPPS